MKKILIITPCDLPVPAVKGGAVSQLVTSLIKMNEKLKKVYIDIISIYDQDIDIGIDNSVNRFFYLKKNKFILHFDKMINRFISLFHFNGQDKNIMWKLYVILKSKNIIKKNKYDSIILENSGYLLNIFSMHRKTKFNGEIFYHLHNDIPNNVTSKKLECFNLLVISSYLMKKIYYRKLHFKKKIIFQNCIDTQKFSDYEAINEDTISKIRQKLGIKDGDKVFIYVGRIVEYKGVLQVINAFNKLNMSNSILLIIGSTNFALNQTSKFELKITQMCKKYANIKKIGFVENENLKNFYRISDIAIMPSLWNEPAGLTMLEACCSGKPLITTRVGGIPEYLDDKYVYFVDNDENIEKNILEKINFILKNYDACKNFAEEYRIKIMQKYNEQKYYNNFLNIINIGGENR